MPKKTTKGTKAPEAPIEEGKRPAPKKSHNEIDDIFAGKKRKKPVKDNVRKHDLGVRADGMKKKKAKDYDKNIEIKEYGSGSRQRKKTADGFTLYTEEELRIGNRDAGATRLCPFDCDCCF